MYPNLLEKENNGSLISFSYVHQRVNADTLKTSIRSITPIKTENIKETAITTP